MVQAVIDTGMLVELKCPGQIETFGVSRWPAHEFTAEYLNNRMNIFPVRMNRCEFCWSIIFIEYQEERTT